MTKTDKAIRIIETAMRAGASNIEAASNAEKKTGLSIITDRPRLYYHWPFFVITRNGRRVLRYHAVHTPPQE